ncbi:MAG: FAD-dependent oxidoreductase [Alphaproteobacteria bacterium]
MKTHARVVVIGGGIAGCALLYHLARLGWTDSVLVEKGELTSGSTWHAAGNTPHYSTGYTTSRIYLESTRFYQDFARETGEDVGFHKCGGIRLSINRDHEEEHKRACAKAKLLGMGMELISPKQACDLLPYMEMGGILSAAWTRDDGYIDPASITNALARQARAKGAEIYRHTRVTGTVRANGQWRVETDKGVIVCEVVVNAAGLWGREIAAMVGYHPPVVPMERQYLVTEAVEGIAENKAELPILRDISAPLYLRQERNSLLLGLFDEEPVFWAKTSTPPGFDQELLVPDLERVSHAFERAVARIPLLAKLGVKRVINGPLMRSPDGNPVIGPVPGLSNYWMNGGYFAGFGLSGALNSRLAEWIVGGEPEIDLTAFDLRRYGGYATGEFTMDSTRAAYVHEFSVAYPHEEHPVARGARVSTIYGRQRELGAVFAARNGWEVPNWYAPPGVVAEDEPSYARANWFPHVAQEAMAAARAAALFDLSSLAKFEVSGARAAEALDRMCANRLPDIGSGGPSLVLSPKGKTAAYVAVLRQGRDRFWITGSALLEQHLGDLLDRHVAGANVEVANVTGARGTLLLAGPHAQAILEAVGVLAPGLMKRGEIRAATIGLVPVHIIRLSAVGAPGWEIHAEAPYMLAVFEAVSAAGREHGLKHAGARAFDTLRIEMGMPRWGVDFGAATAPKSVGLAHFAAPEKGEFIGRKALLAAAEPENVLVLLRVDDKAAPRDLDPVGTDTVRACEKIVGMTTSVAFGHRTGARLALAFVLRDYSARGTALAIEVMGHGLAAQVVAPPTQLA